jgi:GNAT superfamily N-acetyltransferase
MSEDGLPETLRLDDHPSAAEQDAVNDQLNAFNMACVGRKDFQPLNYVLREADDSIVAGVLAFTWGGGCEIRILWVREDWRGRGLGKRLLSMVEREAVARGAGVVLLDTFDFQASDFYPKYGYELVGVVENYPVGHRRSYYQKQLPTTLR